MKPFRAAQCTVLRKVMGYDRLAGIVLHPRFSRSCKSTIVSCGWERHRVLYWSSCREFGRLGRNTAIPSWKATSLPRGYQGLVTWPVSL